MNEIDTAAMLRTDALAKNITTNSSKKQAWLKELEQARQISSYSRDTAAKHEHNDMPAVGKNTATSNQLEQIDAMQRESGGSARGETVKPVETVAERVSGVQTPQPGVMPSQQSELNPGARLMMLNRTLLPSVQPGASIEQLESRYKSEYSPQNMKLIPEAEGVRVLFRDYRMDSRSIEKIVSQLKKELKELGIPVLSVVVNGRQIFDSNII